MHAYENIEVDENDESKVYSKKRVELVGFILLLAVMSANKVDDELFINYFKHIFHAIFFIFTYSPILSFLRNKVKSERNILIIESLFFICDNIELYLCMYIFSCLDIPIIVVVIFFEISIIIKNGFSYKSIVYNILFYINILITYNFLYANNLIYDVKSELMYIYPSLLALYIGIGMYTRKIRDKLEKNDLEKIYYRGLEKDINLLFDVNKISAKLNNTVNKNEIIKIVLKKIYKMIEKQNCYIIINDNYNSYIYDYEEFLDMRNQFYDINPKIIDVREDILKMKSINSYKNIILNNQPFSIKDLVDKYEINNKFIDSEKTWLYMFLIISTSTEMGYVFFGSDNQFDKIKVKAISLLVNQLGSALTISKIYEEEKSKVDTDLLTRAKSRQYLFDYLEKKINNYEAYNERFTLFFFDIDNFKSFNDTYGHDLGDEVLKIVVGVIKNILGDKGIIARYGGEEFIVVLDGFSFKQSYYFGDSMREAIANYPIKEEFNIERNITVSIGMSQYKKNKSISKFIKEADEAMYYAKKHGKNMVFPYKALHIINENKGE